jgi:hypothetical protein
MGGGRISGGHLRKTLSNPIYVGRLGRRGPVHIGLHAPIVDAPTWDRVQSLLAEQTRSAKRSHEHSNALLLGKLFDDRGNRMSPSAAAKGGRRWRYYISQAVLQRRKQDAGSLARAPAPEVEKQVSQAIRGAMLASALPITDFDTPMTSRCPSPPENDTDLRDAIERVTISRTAMEITLVEPLAADSRDRTLTVPWTRPSPSRRREIIQGDGDRPSAGPMRVKARVVLVEALRRAHRWLAELLTDPRQSVEAIAAREGKSERSIRMTLSLAFLAPAIVKAAIEGRLPRGFGVKRLVDAPMAWSEQWAAFGLTAPPPN